MRNERKETSRKVLLFDDGSFSTVSVITNGSVDVDVEAVIVSPTDGTQGSTTIDDIDEKTFEELRQKQNSHSMKLQKGDIKLTKNRQQK